MIDFGEPVNNTGSYIMIVFLALILITICVLFGGYVNLGWLRKQKFIGEECSVDADCGHVNLYCGTDKVCAAGIPSMSLDTCLAANACENCASICGQNLTKEQCKAAGKCPTCT